MEPVLEGRSIKMDNDVAIKVDHVSKKYCKSLKRSMLYGMKDIGRNTVGLSSHSEKLRKDEFWAVDDISFEVKKGEVLGIIGMNGSGKTTMLKLLNGIFWPDKGKISISGKMGALIALGAGFHTMLTGRENIYVNGAILGMTKKEIDKKFDDIIEFADIGEFIDSPVKFYSSGMFVKLGFSIAINIEPEILLIDEVLSVGDLSFQNKSLRRMAELREKANAVVFVSHNLEHVRNLCDRVLMLNNGKQVFIGDTHEVIIAYEEITRKKQQISFKPSEGFSRYMHASSGDIVFRSGGIIDQNGNKVSMIQFGEDIRVFYEFEVNSSIEDAILSASIIDQKVNACIWQMSNDKDKMKSYDLKSGVYRLTVDFKSPQLSPGIYSPSISIRNRKTGELLEKIIGYVDPFIIGGDFISRGIVHPESEWKLDKIDEKICTR